MILVTPFDSILNVAQDIYWMFPLSLLLKDKFESWRKVEDINADSLVIIGAGHKTSQDFQLTSRRLQSLCNEKMMRITMLISSLIRFF